MLTRNGAVWSRLGIGLLAVLATAACRDDATGPSDEEVSGQITVFATDSVFFAIDDSITQVTPPAAWDFGVRQTAVFLREGGTPLLAACICQNAAATDAQIVAMTPESEAADFEAVTAADVPAANDPRWATTTFATSPWYKYNLIGTNHIHPTFQVYLIKKGTAVYKLQIINYYNAAIESRHVTFRYERLAS